MQEGAGGCRRVQEGAGECRRVQEGAGGCRRVQGGAGCRRVQEALAVHEGVRCLRSVLCDATDTQRDTHQPRFLQCWGSSKGSRDPCALAMQLHTGWEQGPASSHFPAADGNCCQQLQVPSQHSVQHGQAEGCR